LRDAQLVLARYERSYTAIQYKSFNAPDEVRRFPKGILTLVHLGSVGMGRAVFFDAEARAVLVVALDVACGQVVALRGITNPEKLRHLNERPALGRKN
jgi:hypothetical protein